MAVYDDFYLHVCSEYDMLVHSFYHIWTIITFRLLNEYRDEYRYFKPVSRQVRQRLDLSHSTHRQRQTHPQP